VSLAVVIELHQAGRVAPSLTEIDGKAAIRAALFNHRTEACDLDALIEGTLRLGRAATGRGGAA